MHPPIAVLKFGSSVLPGESSLPVAIREITHWLDRGHRVIAVVSAMGDATDRLLKRASAYEPADDSSTALLLATGELTSAALLGLALGRAGVNAVVHDSAGIGLRCKGHTLDSRVASLDVTAVLSALAKHPVLVVPGFLARDEENRTALLGRGGSDLSALFIATEIGAAQCFLLKDVDGIYTSDPASDPGAARFVQANYDRVLELSEGIVQHKAVRFARIARTSFTVAAPGRFEGTRICGGETILAPKTSPPLQIAVSSPCTPADAQGAHT